MTEALSGASYRRLQDVSDAKGRAFVRSGALGMVKSGLRQGRRAAAQGLDPVDVADGRAAVFLNN